ncbi:MAG: hypothetical protein E6H02_11805, partial [Bacillati bacterium ANGP1]
RGQDDRRGHHLLSRPVARSRVSGLVRKDVHRRLRGHDGRGVRGCGRDRHLRPLRGPGGAGAAGGERGARLAHHRPGGDQRDHPQPSAPPARGQHAGQLQHRGGAVQRAHHPPDPRRRDRPLPGARERDIRVVEDCSQAHAATVAGRPVGTFGDIAAFSTMYRKAHITGPSGGVVYSRDLELFRRALAYADRGKPRWRPDFDDRNPGTFLFPALNHHSDEISCAIGLASLRRINDTIVRRLAFVADLSGRLSEEAGICRPYGYSPGDSPFVYPILVDVERIACPKVEFALAVQQEGIGLNPHYQYVVADWPWVKRYLADGGDTPNARAVRDRSFMLYLNENYGEREAMDVTAAIVKVEQYYGR